MEFQTGNWPLLKPFLSTQLLTRATLTGIMTPPPPSYLQCQFMSSPWKHDRTFSPASSSSSSPDKVNKMRGCPAHWSRCKRLPSWRRLINPPSKCGRADETKHCTETEAQVGRPSLLTRYKKSPIKRGSRIWGWLQQLILQMWINHRCFKVITSSQIGP